MNTVVVEAYHTNGKLLEAPFKRNFDGIPVINDHIVYKNELLYVYIKVWHKNEDHYQLHIHIR